MKAWLFRFWFYLWFYQLSLYKWVSWFHRWRSEQQFLRNKLDLYEDYRALSEFTRNRALSLNRKPDRLLAAANSPQYVQAALFGRVDAYERFDSSAYATFSACVLENSLNRRVLSPWTAHNPLHFTALWQEHDGSMRIRHACVVMTAKGTWAYLDRGLLTGFSPSLQEIGYKLVKHYATCPATLLCWAIASPDLTPVYAQWRWRP